MELHGRAARCQALLTACSTSSASVRLRSLLSKGSVPAFPKNLSKACAHSFFVAFASCGLRAILHCGPLPPTCSIMTSARIASPCFPLPRFELGLSSRVPQVSAKRVPLSCTTKSRFSRSCVTMQSMLARPRHTCCHHPLHRWSSYLMSSTTRSWTPLVSSSSCICVQGRTTSLLAVQPGHRVVTCANSPWHSMATSTITSSLVQSFIRTCGRMLVVQLE